MNTKRIICALMCAILLVTAVVPAFADSYGHYRTTLSGIGVSAHCEASFSLNTHTGKITLSYLPDPSNHFPPGDYSTRVWKDITDVFGGIWQDRPSSIGGMTGIFQDSLPFVFYIDTCLYMFRVNGTDLNDIEL